MHTPEFTRLQYDFAAHIRDPEQHAKPVDVEDRRMKIYRELFFNNMEGFLASNFPVFKSLLSQEAWLALVRQFMAEYPCHSPHFLEIGQEFLTWVGNLRTPQADDQPFMQELLHYEWVELALEASQAEPQMQGVDPQGDLLAGHPVQSPLAWSLVYRYPVHCIRPDYQPQQPPEQPSCLLVYRNRQDEVKFMQVPAVTAHLLHLLDQDPALTGQAALEQVAEAMGQAPDSLLSHGLELLEELRTKDILLGARCV